MEEVEPDARSLKIAELDAALDAAHAAAQAEDTVEAWAAFKAAQRALFDEIGYG